MQLLDTLVIAFCIRWGSLINSSTLLGHVELGKNAEINVQYNNCEWV